METGGVRCADARPSLTDTLQTLRHHGVLVREPDPSELNSLTAGFVVSANFERAAVTAVDAVSRQRVRPTGGLTVLFLTERQLKKAAAIVRGEDHALSHKEREGIRAIDRVVRLGARFELRRLSRRARAFHTDGRQVFETVAVPHDRSGHALVLLQMENSAHYLPYADNFISFPRKLSLVHENGHQELHKLDDLIALARANAWAD